MAATNTALLTIGLPIAATIAQYQPLTATGAAASAAGNAVGFAQVAGVSGDRLPVVVAGTSIAIAGAAIAAGALVEVHTTVTQVVTKSAGVSIGRALMAASAAGDQIEVLIIPQ